MEDIVYVNGRFLEYDEACVGIEDRGYQFADGVYEVVVIYRSKPFLLEEHLTRLKMSADELEITGVDFDLLEDAITELMNKNPHILSEPYLKLYIQVTRGVQPRSHAYSDHLTPGIVLQLHKFAGHPSSYYEKGVQVITLPDERWARCYIKSIALLPNVLAKMKAKKAGAFEAIFIRDGFAMEGTSSNFFIVRSGRIFTPPASNYILNGINRRLTIREAKKLGFSVIEKSISLDELYKADEIFLTGTSTEVMPVVEIEGVTIGDGKPGEISKKLLSRYRELLKNN